MSIIAGSTARGLPYPGHASAADVPTHIKALADAIETMNNSPLVLGSTLEALTTATVTGTGTSGLVLYSSSSGANLRRSRLLNDTGVTRLQSVNDAFSTTKTGLVLDHATGGVDFPNGLTESTRRGKSIIATTETRTNTAYGTLTTPDQVTVVLPTDGLIEVLFQATWQESVGGAARAAIFIGANQLKVAGPSVPVAQETSIPGGGPAQDGPLGSYSVGLQAIALTNYSGDVTTGQVVGTTGGGGPCHIFNLPAGTYTISVQFKASSGSVTVKNRKLWVKAEAY